MMSKPLNALSPQVQAMLDISAQYLLGTAHSAEIQRYRQLWLVARSKGDRQSLHALRQQVVAVGRELQRRKQTRQTRLLWLDLLSLRCSMVIPRMRF